MREILFKAKRIDNGEWIFGNLLITDDDGACIIQNHIPHHLLKQCEVDKNTICEYTGLTDKNGNKIWENDIVKFDVYNYEKLISSTISDIKWCKNLCSLSVVVNNQGVRGTLGHFLDNNKEVEVIGNVFDNPELLRGGAE